MSGSHEPLQIYHSVLHFYVLHFQRSRWRRKETSLWPVLVPLRSILPASRSWWWYQIYLVLSIF